MTTMITRGKARDDPMEGTMGGNESRMSLSPMNPCLSAMAEGWHTRFQSPTTSFTLCPTCLYVFEMRRVDASAAATKSARQKEEAAVPFYAMSLWVRERSFIGEVTLSPETYLREGLGWVNPLPEKWIHWRSHHQIELCKKITNQS